MIHSMTGYAACVHETEGGSLHLEIRSVNNRFLDVSFRIADTLRALESALRGKVAARLQRGKVECRLFFSRADGSNKGVLNEASLHDLCELEKRVRAILPDARPFSVAEALAFPGVWRPDGESGLPDNAALQEAALALADQALDELLASRAREGEKLIRMILERGANMREILARIAPLIPAAEAEFLASLRQRVSALIPNTLTSDSMDESLEKRLLQETMLFAAKGDVAEEISRLQTHLDELNHIGNTGGAVGKRLDFLTQELNREANTLASKAVSTQINQAALELKLLIEQIREQAQNIE
jgi:uncharacterized protein (TIGR00255 family)